MVPNTKVFVGSLPPGAKPQELRRLFENFGNVVECDIMNRCGFVHMETADQASNAIQALNKSNFKGATISVEPGRLKERNSGGGGGGGSGGGGGGNVNRSGSSGGGGGQNRRNQMGQGSGGMSGGRNVRDNNSQGGFAGGRSGGGGGGGNFGFRKGFGGRGGGNMGGGGGGSGPMRNRDSRGGPRNQPYSNAGGSGGGGGGGVRGRGGFDRRSGMAGGFGNKGGFGNDRFDHMNQMDNRGPQLMSDNFGGGSGGRFSNMNMGGGPGGGGNFGMGSQDRRGFALPDRPLPFGNMNSPMNNMSNDRMGNWGQQDFSRNMPMGGGSMPFIGGGSGPPGPFSGVGSGDNFNKRGMSGGGGGDYGNQSGFRGGSYGPGGSGLGSGNAYNNEFPPLDAPMGHMNRNGPPIRQKMMQNRRY